MVLRKIAINNSVRYIPITEQTKEKNYTKNKKMLVNKTKIFQKTIKKSLKM